MSTLNRENEFASRRACSEFEARLEDYLDGVLDASELRKVTEHLKSCADCSEALVDASAAAEWVRHEARPVGDPGPAFARVVMARIRLEEEKEGRGFWGPFVSLAWKFATTAALALIVMLAYASHGTAANEVANSSVATVSSSSDVQEFLTPTASAPPSRSELTQMITESDANAER